ncbi:hypothetical protein C8A03DRAFT_20017, partial [Achaetomium macrosporum]
FVRLAGETGKPRSCWKDEFNRKLYSTFERDMARSYIDPTVSFQEFVREAQQIAMINKRVSERRAAERQPKPKSSKPVANRGSTKTLSTKPAADPGKKLTRDEVRTLYEAGRCFTCREKGHVSKECPQKGDKPVPRMADPDREARIAELQDRWAGPAEVSSSATTNRDKEVRFEGLIDSEN